MKSVQMMLYSYFIYHGIWVRFREQRPKGTDVGTPLLLPLQKVTLTSASNKLKVLPTIPVADTTPSAANAESASVSSPKKKGGKGGGGAQDHKKTTYKERKQQAIEQTAYIVGHAAGHEKWAVLLARSTKKEQDDLSDCFLQGLYIAKTLAEKTYKAAQKKIKEAHKRETAAKKAAIQASRAAKKKKNARSTKKNP